MKKGHVNPEKQAELDRLIADKIAKEEAEAKEKAKEAKEKPNKSKGDFFDDVFKPGQSKTSRKVLYQRMIDIKPKPINWLWPGRIACGKVTLIAGDPGLGKSQITAYLAGIVTTGGHWPVDGTKSPKGAVVFLSAEDDAADTINPRLRAVDADLSLCVVVHAMLDTDETGTIRKRSFSLKNDLISLESVLHEIGNVRLIVIDPITSYLGGIDSHKNSDVRELLIPLVDFAEKHEVAFVCISHLNKSNTQDAMSRISGSGAFVAVSRSTMQVFKDKNNPARRLLLQSKNNLGKDIGGFAFSIADVKLENGLETSRIVWEDAPVNMTADEAMNARPEQSTAIDKAKQFLLDILSNGPLAFSDIEEAAKLEGISEKTLRRAKEIAGIETKKDGFNGCWIWAISEDGQPKMAKPHIQHLAIFDESRTTQGLEAGKFTEDGQAICLGNFVKSEEVF